MDMVIHPREHDLVLGTFGRGIYVLDDVRPLREMVKEGTQILSKVIHVFEPAEAYIKQIQDPAGTLFPGNGTFIGENRSFGAQVNYVINKPAEEKKDESTDKKTDDKAKKPEASKDKPADDAKNKIKYDSVTFEVFNARNEKIRTIKQKAPETNGINKFSWQMNEKGARGASREKTRAGAPEPGGATVLPGTYKVRVTFGNQKDSTNIKVNYDPRYTLSSSVIESRYDMAKNLDKLTALSGEATNRLRESKEIAEEFEKKMKEVKGEQYKDALEKTKVVKDSINALFDYILGKEDKRQGIVRQRDPTPVSYIGNARYYISTSLDPIGETDQRVMKLAEDQIAEVISRVNAFYEKQWTPYRAAMEKVVISPFKDYVPLKKE
jgi:hypothetical protein